GLAGEPSSSESRHAGPVILQQVVRANFHALPFSDLGPALDSIRSGSVLPDGMITSRRFSGHKKLLIEQVFSAVLLEVIKEALDRNALIMRLKFLVIDKLLQSLIGIFDHPDAKLFAIAGVAQHGA